MIYEVHWELRPGMGWRMDPSAKPSPLLPSPLNMCDLETQSHFHCLRRSVFPEIDLSPFIVHDYFALPL